MSTSTCRDGYICGEGIKKNSIPGDRIDKTTLKEIIKEFIKEAFHEKWFTEILEEYLKDHYHEIVTEEWFKEIICQVNCDEEDDFIVTPQTIIFPAQGGTETVRVQTGVNNSWIVSTE